MLSLPLNKPGWERLFCGMLFAGKTLSIFSRPVDLQRDTFRDDLKPDVREQF